MKLYSVYYCAYDVTDWASDSTLYPIFFSLDKQKVEDFYNEQIKDAEKIIEQTPTFIKYSHSLDERWIYEYEIVESEFDKDLRIR